MEVITIKKTLIIFALTVFLSGAAFVGATTFASAQANNSPYTSLVEKIAAKFGLNKADVQAVFDQDRLDRQAQMETRFEERLTADVNAGKITDAQKQLIIAKRKELQAKRQSEIATIEGKTAVERKELEDWAKQNGIDAKYLFPRFGKGMHMHGMMK